MIHWTKNAHIFATVTMELFPFSSIIIYSLPTTIWKTNSSVHIIDMLSLEPLILLYSTVHVILCCIHTCQRGVVIDCLCATQKYSIKSIMCLLLSWSTQWTWRHIALKERPRLESSWHVTLSRIAHDAAGHTVQKQWTSRTSIFHSLKSVFCCPESCLKAYPFYPNS